MINFKNSLKKALVGAFSVITMLSPFQNALCWGEDRIYYGTKYFYGIDDIALMLGFDLKELPRKCWQFWFMSGCITTKERDFLDTLDRIADKFNDIASEICDKTCNNISLAIPEIMAHPPQPDDTASSASESALVKIAKYDTSEYIDLPAFDELVTSYNERIAHLATWGVFAKLVEQTRVLLRVNLNLQSYLENPDYKDRLDYSFDQVDRKKLNRSQVISGEYLIKFRRSLVCLKMLFDYASRKMSVKEKSAILFGDKYFRKNSPLPVVEHVEGVYFIGNDGEPHYDVYSISCAGNSILRFIYYLNTRGEEDDIHGICKERERLLGKNPFVSGLVKECKQLIAKIAEEATEIYEECGATLLIDDAEFSGMAGYDLRECDHDGFYYEYDEDNSKGETEDDSEGETDD